MSEQKKEILEYRCPVCNSDDRLAQSLAEQLKERGLMREEIKYYANHWEGMVQDPAKEAMIPIGSALPGFRIYLDICRHCGCCYAPKVELFPVVQEAMPISRKPPSGMPFSPS